MGCAWCGVPLRQKVYWPSGRTESLSNFLERKFCDRKCMAKAMEKERCESLSHSRLKAQRLGAPSCELCGSTQNLQVHHKDEDPRNNDLRNLKTLCASCHKRTHLLCYDPTTAQRKPCRFCTAPSFRNDLCATHRSRFKRFGHPLAKKRKVRSEWVLMLHDGSSWLPFRSWETE